MASVIHPGRFSDDVSQAKNQHGVSPAAAMKFLSMFDEKVVADGKRSGEVEPVKKDHVDQTRARFVLQCKRGVCGVGPYPVPLSPRPDVYDYEDRHVLGQLAIDDYNKRSNMDFKLINVEQMLLGTAFGGDIYFCKFDAKTTDHAAPVRFHAEVFVACRTKYKEVRLCVPKNFGLIQDYGT